MGVPINIHSYWVKIKSLSPEDYNLWLYRHNILLYRYIFYLFKKVESIMMQFCIWQFRLILGNFQQIRFVQYQHHPWAFSNRSIWPYCLDSHKKIAEQYMWGTTITSSVLLTVPRLCSCLSSPGVLEYFEVNHIHMRVNQWLWNMKCWTNTCPCIAMTRVI